MNISIIICCYNSANKICAVLNSIKNQTLIDDFNYELIIINNNSTDNTNEVVEQYFNKNNFSFEYKIILETEVGLAAARRRGFYSSKYEYILFVDDDNILCDDFFLISTNIFEKNKDVAVLGTKGVGEFEIAIPEFINSGYPFSPLFNNLAINNPNDKYGMLEKGEFVFGACSFYKRSLLEKCFEYGLFLSGRKGNLLLSGEDGEMCHIASLLDYKIYRTNEVYYKHLIPANRLNKEYFIKLYKGFGYSQYILDLYVIEIKGSNPLPNIVKYTVTKVKSLVAFIGYKLLPSFVKNKYFKLYLFYEYNKELANAIRDNSNQTASIVKKIRSINK